MTHDALDIAFRAPWGWPQWDAESDGEVLTTGCASRHLPPCFGASKSTVHRRFTIWSDAGL
ncbi:hypothetical protein AB0C36_42595 [Streptodolium elevatio]|uniref:Transposase n=1 Tax=Streptodolium elevatio TaxID=3157996 RepID=A0ABV3DWN2_9ACTN